MSKLSRQDFKILLSKVAEGLNGGDARKAADCFTEDAVYMEPAEKHIYQDKNEIFEYFSGVLGREEPVHLTWHYLIFDEDAHIGTGEYTFSHQGQSRHGMVIVKIVAGKIKRWREYQYHSTETWIEFIGKSTFWKI